MSTRTVTDCDRCGKPNILESFRIEVPTGVPASHGTEPGRVRRDLDTACLGACLQEFLNQLSPEQGTEFLSKLQKTGKSSKAAETSNKK